MGSIVSGIFSGLGALFGMSQSSSVQTTAAPPGALADAPKPTEDTTESTQTALKRKALGKSSLTINQTTTGTGTGVNI